MATWAWILIAIVIVIVLIALVVRWRRTTALRERFGPEYDRTVEARDGRRAAEADLREREKQHKLLDLRPLPEETRLRFAGEWRAAQQRFVDQPADAVVAADKLVYDAMNECGYPMADFGTSADMVSVDHPEVAENYRVAHGIRERAQERQASTEDLREAMVRYRSLFDELLRTDYRQTGEDFGQEPGGILDDRADGPEGRGLDRDLDGRDIAAAEAVILRKDGNA